MLPLLRATRAFAMLLIAPDAVALRRYIHASHYAATASLSLRRATLYGWQISFLRHGAIRHYAAY